MEEKEKQIKVPVNPEGKEEQKEVPAEQSAEGTPVDAEALLDEGAKTIEENGSKSDEALEQGGKLPGENDGSVQGGEEKSTPKKRVYSQLGKANQAMTTRSLRANDAQAVYAADETTFNDLDAYDRDVAAKERGLKKIETSIIREGTKVPNNEYQETSTAESTVYDLNNHIVKDIIGGVNTYAGIDAPGQDQRATVVVSKDGTIRLGDTIIHTTEDQKGLDKLKAFEGFECMLLNGMNPDGRVISFNSATQSKKSNKDEEVDFDYNNAFYVLVRTGNYLVRGMRLYKEAPESYEVTKGTNHNVIEDYRELIGYVQRMTTSGSVYEIPVFVSRCDLFDVIDLTPTFNDVKSIDDEDTILKYNMICNETRELMAEIQVFDQTIQHLVSQAKDAPEFMDDKEFGSYAQTHRSSLTISPKSAFRQVDQSCYNTPGAIVNVVRQTQQLEALWLLPRLPFGVKPSDNLFDDLKMHKYLEGKRVNFDYAINNAGINAATNYQRPTILNFWDEQETAAKHDTIEKVMFESSSILKKMDNIIAAYDKYLSSDYMNNIKLAQEEINKMVDILAYGKLDDMDTVSTNNILKFGGNCGLVFGVNPNDFINYDFRTKKSGNGRIFTNTVRVGNKDILRVYPWGGWINFTYGNGDKPTNVADYTFCPSFIRAYCEAIAEKNSVKLYQILGKKTNNPNIVTALDYGDKFYPLLADTDVAKFQDIALAQILIDTETDTVRGVKTHDGLARLMKLIDDLADYGVSYSNRLDITLPQVFEKIIKNTQLYPQANATNTQDFPILFDSAKKFLEYDRDEYQIGVLSANHISYLYYEADPRDKHQSYFNDMILQNEISNFNGITNIKELIKEIYANSPKIMLYQVGEHEYIVVEKTANANIKPLIFKRGYTSEREFGKSRPILRDGATAVNGEDENAVTAYLSHDDHYWINEHEYIMLVRTHYASTDDVNGTTHDYIPNKLEWDINFHPVDIVATPTERNASEDLFNADYFISPVKTCPQLIYTMPNIYGRTDNTYRFADDARTVSGATRSYKFTRNAPLVKTDRSTHSSQALYECDLIGRLTLPSLYGHNFRNAGKLIDYTYNNSGDIVWTPHISNKNGARSVDAMELFSNSNDKCKHYQNDDSMFTVLHMEFYAPYTVIDGDITATLEDQCLYKLLVADAVLSDEELISAENRTPVRLDEYRYFARTKSYYYHAVNRICSSDTQYEKFNIHAALADFGFLLSFDAFAFAKETKITELTHEGATRSGIGDPNQQWYFHFAKAKYNPTVAALIADYFTKFGPERPIMFMPTMNIFCIQPADSIFTAAKAAAFHFVPYNAEVNPVVNSKYYIDGYTFTNFYEAIRVENQNWTDFRANNTRFKDKFFAKSE